MAGVGNMRELGDVVAAQKGIKIVLPAGARLLVEIASMLNSLATARVPGECSGAERDPGPSARRAQRNIVL